MTVSSKLVSLILILIALAVGGSTQAAPVKKDFITTPVLNNGEKWRIAYYEGGPYVEYHNGLRETLRGLMDLGWIEPAPLPPESGEDTTPIWHWLTTEAKSDYLAFVADGHYSGNWDENVRRKVSTKIMERLNTADDIDMMLAMGTWAGKDLANDQHDTPTLVFHASDPVAGHIIESIDDSGLPHLHAAFDASRDERQVRIFHEMINFKKLGVAYEDSVDGRSYGAIDVIEKTAKNLGFELVHCYTTSDSGDDAADAESVKRCFRELANQVDAIYVSQQNGVRLNSIPDLVNIAIQYKVPTFSQAGSEEVKFGFLASISHASFSYIGQFHAKTMTSVFNGIAPNNLSQRLEPPPKIAINLKTAESIGFNPPILLLGAADEIYDNITTP